MMNTVEGNYKATVAMKIERITDKDEGEYKPNTGTIHNVSVE